MKTLFIFVIMFFAAIGTCQYSVTVGTPSHAIGTVVVETYVGPLSQPATIFKLNAFGKCQQDFGDASEPCPWTLPFQALYDNTWGYDCGVQAFFLAAGASINLVSILEENSNDEVVTRLPDAATFGRSYRWRDWPEEKVWFN